MQTYVSTCAQMVVLKLLNDVVVRDRVVRVLCTYS